MRNLKRALSLALASVMLLGMMVVGTSAASINDFTDVDEINNKEAVAIATGLGIFDGYTDGSFGPEKAVTRAEAAVVIAKILHGSDVNPSNLAGAGKFTDVPAWAEGYVNLVSALKIIEGRGNGIFDPNATVTTVEFTTMLLKALGYYVDVETALNADWKLEVTSKANALGLYGDLELGMNAPLSREDVAALTFNALFAQRVAYNDYRGQYVKATDRDVVVTNGTVDDLNTLADNTFGLYSVEGTVIANGMTDEALSETLKSEAQTTVVFADDVDLNKDGKAEFAEGDEYDFEVETGLDMIGHAATVYYTIEKKAPVVFAIVDEATLVAEITYSSNDTTLTNRANDAGFKKNTILNIEAKDYIVNYDMDTTVENDDVIKTIDKLIVISNTSNYEVDYVIAIDQYLDLVDEVDEDDDEIIYDLENKAASDFMVATEKFDEGDYVIVTSIGNKDEILVVEPAFLESGKLTKIYGGTNSENTREVSKITVDGENYTKSQVDGSLIDELFVQFNNIEQKGTVTMVMDAAGKVIGLAEAETIPNYAYIAQFGVRHSTGSLNTTNILTAKVYFADGTSGVYEVDLDESSAQYAGKALSEYVSDEGKATLNGNDKSDINQAAKGLYNVEILADGTIDIDSLETYIAKGTGTYDVDTKLVKGHSTLIAADKKSNVKADGKVLMNNNNTIYFYVNGTYGDDLTVNVVTGIKNVLGFTNEATAGIVEAYYTDIAAASNGDARAEIDVMLIEDVVVDGTDVYYYDGGYEVDEVEDDKWTVTYTLYSLETGDAFTVTYDNNGNYYSSAKLAQIAADKWDNGFYTVGASELKVEATTSKSAAADGEMADGKNVYYVVNDQAWYDEYNENLLTVGYSVGSITEKTIVVDLSDSGLTTVKKIINAVEDEAYVGLTYMVEKDLTTTVLFVTGYSADATIEAPGSATTTNDKIEVTFEGGKATVALKEGTAAKDTKYTVELQVYSVDQLAWGKVDSKVVTMTKGESSVEATFATQVGMMYRVVVDGVVSEL